jgi:propionyl-CoA carboxylase alpha chain
MLCIGVTHNIPLLREVISNPRFAAGDISTKFLAQEYPGGFKGHPLTERTRAELFSVAAMVHAARDLRNRAWGGQIAGQARRTWELWISAGEQDAAHGSVLVKVERLSEPVLDGALTFSVTVGDQAPVTASIDWRLESPLIHAKFNGDPLTVQYLDSLPLGYQLQHYGTKVGGICEELIDN